MKKIKQINTWICNHKKISVLILIILIGLGYWWFTTNQTTIITKYLIGTVKKTDLISTVSGSGQIYATNQTNLKAKASGQLIYLNAKAGQNVKAGTIIASIDSGDAQYELENAQIDYEQLINANSVDLNKAKNTVTTAEKKLTDTYTSAQITLAKTLTDLNSDLNDLNDLYNGYLTNKAEGASKDVISYVKSAGSKFSEANKAYEAFSKTYRENSNQNDSVIIENLINQTAKLSLQTLEAGKQSKDVIIYLRDREENHTTESDNAYSTANNLITSLNSTIDNLTNIQNSFLTNKQALTDAQTSLNELINPDNLTVRNKTLTLKQKQEAVSNYSVWPTFDGLIAAVNVEVGAEVNSGDTIAVIITKEKYAKISLNEVDAAKVKIGQAVKLTFDAIDGLEINGTVSEIDLVGTVSQGVVSYNVKIAFEADDRIKPGMSVNAEITVNNLKGVLVIPNSALKTKGQINFVQKPNETIKTLGQPIELTQSPNNVTVEIGETNDTLTEIKNGLIEGDQIIIKTITGTSTTATQTNNRTNTNNTGRNFGTSGFNFLR